MDSIINLLLSGANAGRGRCNLWQAKQLDRLRREPSQQIMLGRYYGASLGRFLAVDPGGRLERSPQKWNRYTYTLNNPLRYNDPDGRRENPVTRSSGIDPTPAYGEVGRVRMTAANPHIGEFGLVRNGGTKAHKGIDINAPSGTAVVAAAGGTVAKAGTGTGYGNVVYIDHPRGEQTRYAHLSAIKPDLKAGDKIREGQAIGLSGTSGNAGTNDANDTHMHFEVRDPQGTAKDPVQWLNDPNAPPAESELSDSSDENVQAAATTPGGCGIDQSCEPQVAKGKP